MRLLISAVFVFLLSICVTAQTSQRITAAITITNVPADGATIVVNGSTRTWKNTVATPSTQILTNYTVPSCATNLWLQIVANQYSGPVFPTWVSTNQINLVGALGQAMAVTFSGNWATVSLSTQTVSTLQAVRVPMSSEDASVRTNIASLLITNLQSYAQIPWGENAYILTNFHSLNSTQQIANHQYSNSTFYSGALTNVQAQTLISTFRTSNNVSGGPAQGWYFRDAIAHVETVIGPDLNGRASLYRAHVVSGSPTWSWEPDTLDPAPESLLNYLVASNKFPGLSWANNMTGVNTFQQITNSAIVNSTLRYSPGISGTLEAITNGVITGSTITNATENNVTLAMTNISSGILSFSRANISSLANGNNAGIDFGTAVFCKIKAGPTGAFTLNGISGGADGRMLVIYNSTAQNMTIANDSGVDPVAANRIYTGTGGDVTTTGAGAVIMLYDSEVSRWVVTGIQL